MAENYFRLTSLEDGNQISINAVGRPTAVNLQYRTSIAQTWQAYAIGTLISISTNEWIEFRNDTGTLSNSDNDYYSVIMTKAASASGSIMSLLDYNNMDIAVPEWAFHALFRDCTTLREPPALPATTLSDKCYQGMFQSCTSLTTPPELPAMNLATGCYDSMFYECLSLAQAPELPATTMAISCYNSMFFKCSSLTSAPALPALQMTIYCYAYMFSGCTSLTTPPELPATTLDSYCYAYMFNGCTSLTQAPAILPAATLANNCYQSMFKDCTTLTKAPTLPASSLAQYCYAYMFNNCTSLTTPPELPATTLANNCYQYMFTGCNSLTKAPELPATEVAECCYQYMFWGCSLLSQAPSVLPATTLASNCYDTMFRDCTSLTTPPELPATTLSDKCYQGMFQGCTSLTQAPAILPAATLANNCYQSMFNGCTSLTQAPTLPASSLAQYCYAYMFQNCTSLTEAPDMYATNLVNYCCQHMFNGCTNLNHIIWRSKTVPTVSFCNSWLVNASTSGTFEYTQPFLDVASIERNVSGVPEGWNIQQLKPQAGISMKINNKDVNKFMLLGKNISSLSINGVKVKSSTPIGTDVELPSHLTKLLYVDSNGGSLDTGIPTNGYLKVGIKWSKTKTGNSRWPEMFGNRSVNGFPGQYYEAFTFRCNTASGHYDYYHGLYSASYPTYGGRIDIAESSTALSDTVHEYWMNPTSFSFDGQVFNTVDYANTHDKDGYTDWEYQPERLNGQTMVLFSSRTGSREAIINCYNFYIVDTSTNTVLINYVPCKYGTQAGFYDTVSQTFVTNSKFLAGPEA